MTKHPKVDLHDFITTAMEGRSQRPFKEVMAIALKKCGISDANTFYQLMNRATEEGIIHTVVQAETGNTWVVHDEGALPF